MSDLALRFTARPGGRMRGAGRWKNNRITITASGCKAFTATSWRRDCRAWTRWTPRSDGHTGTIAFTAVIGVSSCRSPAKDTEGHAFLAHRSREQQSALDRRAVEECPA